MTVRMRLFFHAAARGSMSNGKGFVQRRSPDLCSVRARRLRSGRVEDGGLVGLARILPIRRGWYQGGKGELCTPAPPKPPKAPKFIPVFGLRITVPDPNPPRVYDAMGGAVVNRGETLSGAPGRMRGPCGAPSREGDKR
jgi:hypothetical protein